MGGGLRDAFVSLLRSVLDDQVLRAAEAEIEHGHVQGCPTWRQLVWSHVPDALQEDCREFVLAKKKEHWHMQQIIAPELLKFVRDFFVPAYEADLIQPLCLLLDFLRVTDNVYDLRLSLIHI